MSDGANTLSVARLGIVDYAEALALQQAMVAARLAGAIGDTIMLLEHPHVFTLGRGADANFITRHVPGVAVHRVSRGGQVTYHGPGQIVGYPIIKLEGAERDVLRYLRKIEQAIIDALARFDIAAGRRDRMTGVWASGVVMNPRKLASIGVGIRRWVTLHGFALNVATDLAWFDAIVPCGIDGCQMTSVAALGRPEITLDAIGGAIAQRFAALFGHTILVEVSAAQLWSLLDPAASGCEARSQAAFSPAKGGAMRS
ncbi:MAG: lipoyl(octanoyl) transferase LipB [Candidatus Binataceae bacterium]|nr:lipoyl(octanoyl) transferase LipB [Candidatus Binataceae bacterium]